MKPRGLAAALCSLPVLLSGLQGQFAGPADIEKQVISDQAEFWWARAAADFNGDGVLDVGLQNNNARGGWLGWLEGRTDDQPWETHIVATEAPGGQTFAAGDLDAGDIDNDGDIDLLALAHPGEWDEGTATTTLYWYENPSWQPHRIGEAPAFVKDLNLVDFNGDQKLDLVAITFEDNSVSVFRQDAPNRWTTVQNIKVLNLHEGMDVGDIDGDGDPDIAANGYWLENPGGTLTEDWVVRSIAEKRHNQTGDWSRNATKVACQDIDEDGRDEVFISHSERAGYPVAYYSTDDPKEGPWKEHVLIADLAAAHTLQVLDVDLDGDQDVLVGMNKGRGSNLEFKTWPVWLLLNEGDNQNWEKVLLTDQGIYNGQVGDMDGDGDQDLFRLSSHDDTVFEWWQNPTR